MAPRGFWLAFLNFPIAILWWKVRHKIVSSETTMDLRLAASLASLFYAVVTGVVLVIWYGLY